MSTEKSTPIPNPGGICQECLKDKKNTFKNETCQTVAAYCDHNKTGGTLVLNIRPLQWHLYTPVDREDWFDLLNKASFDVQRMIGKQSVSGETRH